MTPTPAAQLEKIRTCLASASRNYQIEFKGKENPALLAVIVPGTEPEILARIDRMCPPDDQALLLNARDWLSFMDDLIVQHGRRNAALREELSKLKTKRQGPDYAAECAMKCVEPAFLRYLADCHGLQAPLTPERATTRLKSILAIKSRKELNTNPDKAARWTRLRQHFQS